MGWKFALALGCVTVAFAPSGAQAEISAKDVQVIGRALGFLENPPTGAVELGIVFDPAVPESAKDAEAMKEILGAGLTAGKLTLKPRLVPLAEVGAADGLAAYYVTPGLGAAGDAVAAAAKQRKLATITTEPACVQSGRCVMSVKSQPAVEIVVNKATADAIGIKFASSFRMLIKEI